MAKARWRRSTCPIERLERRFLLALYGPDVSFGEGGHVDVPADSVLAVLPTGKILAIGGRQNPDVQDDTDTEIIASRLNPDGSVDSSFGAQGAINFGDTVRPPTFSGARFYLTDSGSDVNDLLAFTPDGTPDPTFSDDGREPV